MSDEYLPDPAPPPTGAERDKWVEREATNDPDELERELEAGAAVLHSNYDDPTPTTSAERRETAIERAEREHPAEMAFAHATVRVNVALNEWRMEHGDVWCPPEGQDHLVDRVTEAARRDPSAERVAALEAVAEALKAARAFRFSVHEGALSTDAEWEERNALWDAVDAALATLDEHA